MTTTQKQPQLLALLVGIDSYKKPITPLHGCVNDVHKIEAFLEKQHPSFKVDIKTLINEDATKHNMVTSIKNHLGKAKKQDTVLFYYSGHGTQENANTVFWSGEADKKLESLVCYDGLVMVDGKPKMNLLADKELRFLIGILATKKPKIITIFDCCHSGTNTRNGSFSEENKGVFERKVRNRLSMAFPERPWTDFIFSDTISEKDILKKGANVAIEEGEHIQMAACQNDESAYEVNGEGVFTKNLIDILERCNGAITYHRLQSTIQSYLRNQFKQTPKIYVVGDKSKLFSGFLNKEVDQTELLGTVTFNADLGWILDMGSLQGMTAKKELLLHEQNSEVVFKAQISKVSISYSQLSFSGDTDIIDETSKIFKVKIDGLIGQIIHLYIAPQLSLHSEADSLVQKLVKTETVQIVNEQGQADYCLVKEHEELVLCAPEKIGTPIVPRIALKELTSSGSTQLLSYLVHLSKYAFVKYMDNDAAFLLRSDHISIEIFEGDSPLIISNNKLTLNYSKIDGNGAGVLELN